MKTKIYNFLIACLAVVTIGLASTGCNDDKKPTYPVDDTLFDIVTLTATNDDGFTVTTRKIDDSPLVTLTAANKKIDQNLVKVGDRFLLNYIPESGIQYKSGPITAIAYRPILNAKIIEGTQAEHNSWITEAQDIVSMWRTGDFINVYALAPYSQKPAKYELVVDKATLEDEIPQAYLIFLSDNKYESAPQAHYATFDISSVWNKPGVRGLRISTAGISTPTTTQIFTKEDNETIRPNE